MQDQQNENTSLKGKRILVVEDMELNQALARHILESWGCIVFIAANGRLAFQLIQGDRFDLILMDVQMPEMDGVEATRVIRQLPDASKANVPIVAFTANNLNGDREMYLAAGMDDYISKPFDEKRLFQVVLRNLVAGRKEASPAVSAAQIPGNSRGNEEGETKLYDLSMVQSVSEGDPGFLRKMVVLFIKTVPPNVQELVNALETENWDQVRKMAHKLKSTVDSMGINSIREDIRKVEADAKQLQSLDEMPGRIKRIESIINQCIGQLEVEIQ